MSDDEVMLVLGSLDKGADSFVLEEAGPDIDLEGLTLRLDTFEDFGLENRIVSAVSLGGQELLRQPGKRLGRNMLTPKIIAKNGRELELFDFME